MSLLNALPYASFAAALHALYAFKIVRLFFFLLCSSVPCDCHVLSTLRRGQWRKHHNITDINLDVSSVLPEGIQPIPNNTHSISSACFFLSYRRILPCALWQYIGLYSLRQKIFSLWKMSTYECIHLNACTCTLSAPLWINITTKSHASNRSSMKLAHFSAWDWKGMPNT